MPPAVALAGAAVAGSVIQGVAGSKAAKAQERGQQASIAEQRRQYDQTREDFTPWRNAGSQALALLTRAYGGDQTAFTQSPGYQFARDEGLQAIDRQNSARGWLNSGGADKQRLRYATGLASQEYNNWFNQGLGLSGLGQGATQATAQAGQNMANNISQAQSNIGNARASSYANWGSAANNGIQNVLFAYLNNGKAGGAKPASGPYGTPPIYPGY